MTLSIRESFHHQASFCRTLKAPTAARILDLCAENYDDSRIFRDTIGDWSGDPIEEVFPLRFLGGWHALVLTEQLSFTEQNDTALWRQLEQALADHPLHFESYITSPPQTNEVGRSAALLLGFQEIRRRTDLPLSLYEIGSSAGLNLRWDHYQYINNGAYIWGDGNALTKIQSDYRGPPKHSQHPINIAARHGCDVSPIDIHDDMALLRLRSYVWPDHRARRVTLESAIAVSKTVPAKIDRKPADQWVNQVLSKDNHRSATVLFHSIMWSYLTLDQQTAIQDAIEARGKRATYESPFFYLSLEFENGIDQPAHLTLRSWPGDGEKSDIARTDPHCTWVDTACTSG